MRFAVIVFSVALLFASVPAEAAASGGSVRVAARGVIVTGAEKPLPGLRIFFYNVRRTEQIDALAEKMKKRFPKIDSALADSLAKGGSDALKKEQYVVIIGHPLAIASCEPAGVKNVDALGEVVITLKRTAGLGVDREPTRDLGFLVLAVPRSDYTSVLKVVAKQGTAEIRPSSVKTDKKSASLRKYYDSMLESTNSQIALQTYRLARWCEKEGLHDEAREHYARALLLNPLSRRSAEALRRIDVLESLRIVPEKAGQFLARARALMSIGRYSEAKADIDSVLRLDAKAPDALYLRAVYFRNHRMLKEACASLDAALKYAPRRADCLALRARCYALRGMREKAEADARAAAAAAPSAGCVLHLRAFLVVSGISEAADKKERARMYGEALDLLSEAIKADPDSFEAYVERAGVHLALGDEDCARSDCVAAFRLNPYHYLVHHIIGRYHLVMKEPLRAEAAYSVAVSNFPNLYYVYNERGRYYCLVKNLVAALKDFSRAISLDAERDEVYFNRASVEYKLERIDRALKDLDKAVKLSPKRALYRWERARISYDLGNLDSALQDLRVLEELGAANASLYYLKGLIFLHKKNKDTALKNFRRALAMKPSEDMKKELEKKIKEVSAE